MRAASVTLLASLMYASFSASAAFDERAKKFAPLISAEVGSHWPDLPWPHYLAALISHESGCPALRSCWSPTAELRTPREQGLGLGQLTRTWRPDGTVRFDSLADMRNRHPALRELSWNTLAQRPDLQIRAVVLMSRGNWNSLSTITDPAERLAMTNAAYNGGLGGVQSDRRACQIKAGCDPQKWWGHVETTCTKSKAPLYGQRSACDINRDHSRIVMRTKFRQYEGMFK